MVNPAEDRDVNDPQSGEEEDTTGGEEAAVVSGVKEVEVMSGAYADRNTRYGMKALQV